MKSVHNITLYANTLLTGGYPKFKVFFYRVAHEKLAPPTDKEPRPGFSSSKLIHVITVAPQAADMPGD
jgi:hypothetical protein